MSDLLREHSPIREALTDLQAHVGQGNAAKGFHERGEVLRQAVDYAQLSLDNAYIDEDENPGDANNLLNREQCQDDLEEAREALREYETARLALITSEVAEAIEELRSGRTADETWYEGREIWAEPENVLDADFVARKGEGEHAGLVRVIRKNPKPEGVPSEIADVVIRAFDFAHEAGFDLGAIIAEKLTYNASRPFKHGRKF